MENEALIAALEQAQKALEDAIVAATMKKREAPPMEEAAEGEAPPIAPVPEEA